MATPDRHTDRHKGLTREAIGDAALAVVRSDGLDALSLRRLAADLDVWPTAVVHHVGGKQGLIQLVLDGVLDQLAWPSDDLDWQAWMRAFARGTRTLLLEYPGVAHHLAVHGNPSERALRLTDTAIAKLLDAGFTPVQAAIIWIDLSTLVIARIRREEEVGSGDPHELAYYEGARGQFEHLGDDLPALTAAAHHWFSLRQETYLEHGVDLLLRGATTWLAAP